MIIDFHEELRRLLEQIPEGRVTTPSLLAEALGDRRAVRAILEALRREEFRWAGDLVVREAEAPYRDFESSSPLERLRRLQEELSSRVVEEDDYQEAELIAGVDVAYAGDEACAACVVLDGKLQVVEVSEAVAAVDFPYIPGYLAFREALAVEEAVRGVSDLDILMVNGHGLAHPRRCGLATHVGVELDVPSIGVAARRLVGREGEPREGWSPLIHRGRIVGAVLRRGEKRVYISVGHRVSLPTAVELARKTTINRLPEPVRLAHRAASELRRRRLIESRVEGRDTESR
jgi:deoxyribonuclease V